jgi:hypothetical protein
MRLYKLELEVRAKAELRHDRWLNRWLGLMGAGDVYFPGNVTRSLLTRWERTELERVNAGRRTTWEAAKAAWDAAKRRGEVDSREDFPPFEPLTYLPDSAYEATNLMRFLPGEESCPTKC